MIFKVEYLKVTAPLDPTEKTRFIEPTKRKELDNLYNMTPWMVDYVNPTAEGVLIWNCIISCTSNLE